MSAVGPASQGDPGRHFYPQGKELWKDTWTPSEDPPMQTLLGTPRTTTTALPPPQWRSCLLREEQRCQVLRFGALAGDPPWPVQSEGVLSSPKIE